MDNRRLRTPATFRTPQGVILATAVLLALAAAPPAPSLRSDDTLGTDPLVSQNGFGSDSALAAAEGGMVLEPGLGWVSFTWYGAGPVFDREGPFIVDSVGPVTLRITDDFAAGDRFRIYDNGVELAETFDTPVAGTWEHGPDEAFGDDTWSSGIYSLAPGRHELRIQAADNPWSMGRGYLRADPEHTFAVVEPTEMMTAIRPAIGTDRFRYIAAIALGAGSDGILPNFEEVVVSYGRVLRVIPAGAFTCDANSCVYTSDGPGIVRAVLTPNQVEIDAVDVTLCPSSNPMLVGVWIGNDGGSIKARCQGTLRH